MVVELEPKKYPLVLPLLEHVNRNSTVVIRSVIEQNTRGKIFVDNQDAPSTALVWAINCLYYFIGNSKNEPFFDYFEDFLWDNLVGENLDIGCTTFIGEFLGDSSFKDSFNTILKPLKKECGRRLDFTFQKELFLTQRIECFSYDVEAKPINFSGDIGDDLQELSECILEFWSSIDDFEKLGLGYYISDHGRVISSCFSCGVSGNDHEIVLETYNNQDQGKGYGRLVADAFIYECLAKQFVPHWNTDESNIPSRKLAKSLGFVPSKSYEYIEFEFDTLLE